ncbi:MAG: TlpA disulfide reductase family protein [Acidimicrobiales bacterium]
MFGLLGLLVLAIGLGFVLAERGGNGGTGRETAPVEISGAALPAYAGDPVDAAGLAAPDITAQTTVSSVPTQLTMDDGTVRLVEFFVHSCPHCQREVPRQADWLSTHELPAGVEVVTISTGVSAGAPNYPPSAWFDREDWPLPVYVDSPESAIATAYGMTTFPYYVLVDGSGAVVERGSGEMTQLAFAELLDRAASLVPEAG